MKNLKKFAAIGMMAVQDLSMSSAKMERITFLQMANPVLMKTLSLVTGMRKMERDFP